MDLLYSVQDVERLKTLEAASKVLSFETLREIRRQPDIGILGYVVIDRWATYQPDDLKQLEQDGFLQLFHHVMKQQERECDVLLNRTYAAAESHLTIHERLALHEVDTRLIREF